MLDFEEKVKRYQKEDIHNEIMKLNCELMEVIHSLQHKAKEVPEFYFLCTKFVNLQNTVFKLKKELDKDQDQEKKEEANN